MQLFALFQKQPVSNFFKNNRSFSDQEHVGSTETGLDSFINYHLRAIKCGFCCRKGIQLVVAVAIVVAVVVVVVAVVLVIVLAVVVVLVKS